MPGGQPPTGSFSRPLPPDDLAQAVRRRRSLLDRVGRSASTISREPFTPSSVNRNAILRRWAARISSFVGRSQSWRLNGPIAFLRVV